MTCPISSDDGSLINPLGHAKLLAATKARPARPLICSPTSHQRLKVVRPSWPDLDRRLTAGEGSLRRDADNKMLMSKVLHLDF